MIGKTISHYKILEKLGEGGMGVVYKAFDTKLDRVVALKFLPHHLTASETSKARFLQEAKAASAVNHPNVCVIHDILEHEGRQFIVMEYIDGKTLREIILENLPRVLNLREVLDYAIQIADGLKAAHDKGVIHRDVKSENIMVTPTGQIKVTDFGLAKLRIVGNGRSPTLTKTGATLGTLAYISPEQIQGSEVDDRSDIFSFGVVLYEMLTGQLPFQAKYVSALMYSILNNDPTPISNIRHDTPHELERLVNKCLLKEPSSRYQHVDTLGKDLKLQKKALESEDLSFEIPKKPHERKRRISRNKKLLIYIVSVLFLFIFIIIFVNQRISQEQRSAGILHENSIAVMYFENRSSEPDLDKILVDMLTTNLARYEELNVVSSHRLFDILKNLGKLDAKTIDQSVATEVAQQAGVKTMLLGSIIQVGNKFRIVSQLMDVETGNIIGSPQADGEKIEDIFTMVDILTEELVGNLAVSIPVTEAVPFKIADVTTKSLEAYRYYYKGLEKRWKWNFNEAKENFKQAVAIDSTFAIAYLEWAIQESKHKLNNPYESLSLALQLLRKAERHASKASVKEKRLIAASRAYVEHNFMLADSLFSDFVRHYPQEKDAYYLLSDAQDKVGKKQQSINTLEKVLEIDPTFGNAYNSLAYSYSRIQEHEKAISTIKKYIALQPNHWHPHHSAWDIYMNAGQFNKAIEICEQANQINPKFAMFYLDMGMTFIVKGDFEKARENFRRSIQVNSKADKGWMHRLIAYSYAYEGRYQDCSIEFEKAIKSSREQGITLTELGAYLDYAKLSIVQERFSKALGLVSRVIEVSSQTYEKASNPWLIQAVYTEGKISILQGDLNEANTNADTINKLVDKYEHVPFYMDYYYVLLAESYIHNNEVTKAMQALDNVTKATRDWSPHYNSLLAKCYFIEKNTKAAIAIYHNLYQDLSYRYDLMGGDAYDYFFERSKVNYNLAKIYEQQGDTTQAIEYYTRALQQWKNADKDLPELIDTKNRLTRLK